MRCNPMSLDKNPNTYVMLSGFVNFSKLVVPNGTKRYLTVTILWENSADDKQMFLSLFVFRK